MPGFDGAGPQGKGPMTGRARGYCVLREATDRSNYIQGFAGVQGTPVDVEFPEGDTLGERRSLMPGGDRTGPVGRGPMTGRAAGYCAGYPAPGYVGLAGGRGFGGRRWGGRGRRNWYYATGLPFWARAAQDFFFGAPTAEEEREALRQRSQQLQESLNAINQRIEDLEKEKAR